VSFCCEICADVHKVNVRLIFLLLVIFQDEPSLGLLDYPYNVSLKYDHQAFEEGLFVHLSIIIVLHCIMF